jgi:hypothetical protein
MQTTLSTRFRRPRSNGDTYDRFQGADLALVAAGRFSDVEESSQVDSVEITPAQAKKVKKQLPGRTFKNTSVRPQAEHTVTTERHESFRGITLGKNWKIGRYEVRTETLESTAFKVDAELQTGNITAKTTLTVAEKQSSVDTQSGWYFFD